MRSLKSAICTSGEPVSFACTRYCSINSDLTSLKAPLRRTLSMISSCSLRPRQITTRDRRKVKGFTYAHAGLQDDYGNKYFMPLNLAAVAANQRKNLLACLVV